jgi:hypothetical protein
MKKEISKFGAVVSLVAVAVVIVNVVAWGYVSVVGVVVDYDSEAFRNSLVEREDGNWYTPEGYLFVDGTCTSSGVCEASHVIR